MMWVAPLVNAAEVQRFLQSAVAGVWRWWSDVSGTGSVPEKSHSTFP